MREIRKLGVNHQARKVPSRRGETEKIISGESGIRESNPCLQLGKLSFYH